MVYEWGVRHGNGMADAGVALRKRLEDMMRWVQKAHLTRSSQIRFAYAEGLTRMRNLQFIQPQLIAEEVRWVLGVEKT